ncbi:MAG: hypothetical protein KAG97_12630, partial [Victivallales bacterium]|nr:hypothetical protein [Victivallales bacterium]
MNEELSIQKLLSGVDALTGALSRPELLRLFSDLAKAQPVEDRVGFLSLLEKLRSGEKTFLSAEENGTSDAVQVLEEIRAEVEERRTHIENGEYELLDDFDYEDYDYYSHEEPEKFSEDHREVIAEVERQAGHLFLDGCYEKALDVYQALVLFHHQLQDEEFFCTVLQEERTAARNYCRCVFEAAPEEKRVSRLYEAIALMEAFFEFPGTVEGERGLCLMREILEGSPTRAEVEFLEAWGDFLSTCVDALSTMLRVELLALQDRWDEVRALLEALEPQGGSAWMVYVHGLEQASMWDALAVACRQILAFPNEKRIVYVADLLQRAGSERGNVDDVADGVRHRFMSDPSLDNLTMFFQQLPSRERQRIELLRLDVFLSGRPFDGVHAAVKLLLG